MKIQPAKINDFIAQVNTDNAGAILVYGQDSGKVSIVANTIKNKLAKEQESSITTINYEDIKEDHSSLFDTAMAIDIYSTFKIIHVIGTSENICSALKKSLKEIQYSKNACIIFTADELKTTSSTRSFFETSQQFNAIACYADDEQNLEYITAMYLKKKNIQATKDAVKYIADNVQGSRMLLISEIDKLHLYLESINKNTLTLEDAMQCCLTLPQSAPEQFALSLASLNICKISKTLNTLQQTGENTVTLLRYAYNYFTRLRQLKEQVAKGENINNAIKQFKPPVFFKMIPLMTEHTRRHSLQSIQDGIDTIILTEIQCKNSSSISKQILEHNIHQYIFKQTTQNSNINIHQS